MSLEDRVYSLLSFLNSERRQTKNPEYSKILQEYVNTVKDLRKIINQLQNK